MAKKKKNGDELMKQALEDEHKIRKAFKDKDWAEIKSSDSWVIFKVMSEFVEGFEKLAKIGPCVTIFGSARVKAGHPYYKTAEAIAHKLVQHGYGVVTGGGPGIMEAGNKGANRAGGKSVGLNIFLPFEQKGNPYIDPDKLPLRNWPRLPASGGRINRADSPSEDSRRQPHVHPRGMSALT